MSYWIRVTCNQIFPFFNKNHISQLHGLNLSGQDQPDIKTPLGLKYRWHHLSRHSKKISHYSRQKDVCYLVVCVVIVVAKHVYWEKKTYLLVLGTLKMMYSLVLLKHNSRWNQPSYETKTTLFCTGQTWLVMFLSVL